MLRRDGVMADLDADAGATLGRKIRRAQLTHYNFQLGKGERGTPRLLVNPSPPRPCVPPPPLGMGVAALSQWFPAACPPPHPHPDGNWDLWGESIRKWLGTPAEPPWEPSGIPWESVGTPSDPLPEGCCSGPCM